MANDRAPMPFGSDRSANNLWLDDLALTSIALTIEQLRAKHHRLDQNQGAIGPATYCVGCMAPNGVLATKWPCDVIKLLDELEEA